jgi:hypothetical protein
MSVGKWWERTGVAGARFGVVDRSKLGSIDFGIVGSEALRPDSGAASRLR